MNISLYNQLESVLDDRQLLSHPFYRRWEAGDLSRVELRHYAEQYRYFEEMLPVFLEEVSQRLPEGSARNSVRANLNDETGTPSHLELFDRFAHFYGATPAPASPAMSGLVGTYVELSVEGSVASLAGLWAYESQGAAIADSKAQGLIDHYDANSDAATFWAVHGTVEDDHAAWTFEALASLDPDEREVAVATRRIGDAWWAFLDERELAAVQ